MYLNGCAVGTGNRIYGNFKFTRQEGEFRVEGRPLTDDFAVRARINGFFCNHPGVFVGGGVADTVTAGLHGVHLHFGQIGQNLRALLQFWPVKLNVLACGEVGIAFVVFACNTSQRAHLSRIHLTIRHGNPQHGCITLHVNAVLQAQWQELVFGDFAGEVALHLPLKLDNALIQQLLIVLIVYVHKKPVANLWLLEKSLWRRTIAELVYS